MAGGYDTGPAYTAVCHARVPAPETLWVCIGRWDHADGTIKWYVEYWDGQGETAHDVEVADERAGKAYAAEIDGISATDWKPGGQPWGESPLPISG